MDVCEFHFKCDNDICKQHFGGCSGCELFVPLNIGALTLDQLINICIASECEKCQLAFERPFLHDGEELNNCPLVCLKNLDVWSWRLVANEKIEGDVNELLIRECLGKQMRTD